MKVNKFKEQTISRSMQNLRLNKSSNSYSDLNKDLNDNYKDVNKNVLLDDMPNEKIESIKSIKDEITIHSNNRLESL